MTTRIASVRTRFGIQLTAGAVVALGSMIPSYAPLAVAALLLLGPALLIRQQQPVDAGWLAAVRWLAAFDAVLLIARLAMLIYLSLLFSHPSMVTTVHYGAPTGVQSAIARDSPPAEQTAPAVPRPRRTIDLAGRKRGSFSRASLSCSPWRRGAVAAPAFASRSA
jgi:hypothetical protein